MTRMACWSVMLAMGGFLLAGAVADAQEAPPVALTSGNVAVVDIARVAQEYKALLEKNQALQALAESVRAELQARSVYRFLTEEEMQELLKLIATEQPTQEDKDRVKALTDESQKREAELLALESKQEPTDQERSRRSELRAIRQAASQKLDEVQGTYQGQLDAQEQKVQAEVVQAVRKAIEEVATERAHPMVFDRDALLLGGVDITDQVLAKLNAEPTAAAPAEGGAEGGGSPTSTSDTPQ
jgi:Skp family chaperone for outer membrane proteins